jgi:hypothetical protein
MREEEAIRAAAGAERGRGKIGFVCYPFATRRENVAGHDPA